MSALTICHFATLTRWGGVEKMLIDLLLHSKQSPIRHILVTTSSTPDIIAGVHNAGIPSFQPSSSYRYYPGKILKIARWIRSQSVDIIHSYNAYSNSWATLAAHFAGIPIHITGEHGTIWIANPPIAWTDQLANRRAKLVIANSQASARMLTLKYGIPNQKIRVVFNAVADIPQVDSMKKRTQLGIAPDTLIAGSIGRLDTPKDFLTLIDTATIVLKNHSDVVFVLVGGGPLESELRAHVKKLGLESRFIMTGWRRDARELLQIFDLFVNTSISETFGNVLIEAALCRVPVIASMVDGIPEAIIHKKTGLLLASTEQVRLPRATDAAPLPKHVLVNDELLPPRSLDPDLLAQNILELIDDPDLREQYGQQAKERAQKLFTIDRYKEDLESIYMDIAKRV